MERIMSAIYKQPDRFIVTKLFFSSRNNEMLIQKSRWYRNDFHLSVYVKVEPTESGSRLFYKTILNPKTRLFMWFYYVFLIYICLQLVLHVMDGVKVGKASADEYLWLLHPLGMMFGGFALTEFGKWMSKDEAAEISKLIVSQFASSEITG
ncbi:MAG: hypothetical protein H7Z37_01065 [Pyrinomonadaceae bacterium]|nr:hypothetical protein [Pyrinomonadaceae bacterium]